MKSTIQPRIHTDEHR